MACLGPIYELSPERLGRPFFDYVFLGESGNMVEPTIENVCIEIEASPAANFVSDPARFLEHRRRWRT